MKLTCLFVLLLILSFSCSELKNKKTTENPLLGSWNMKEIHWKTTDTTYSILNAQAGIFLFADKNYSIMWTPINEPRIAFKNLSNPTDEEMIAGFKSVVFNAGSYTFTDSTVTTTAEIAKVPGFEGGIQYYKYSIKSDTLSITMFDETYPNGNKPEWFGKFVTKFVMKRTYLH